MGRSQGRQAGVVVHAADRALVIGLGRFDLPLSHGHHVPNLDVLAAKALAAPEDLRFVLHFLLDCLQLPQLLLLNHVLVLELGKLVLLHLVLQLLLVCLLQRDQLLYVASLPVLELQLAYLSIKHKVIPVWVDGALVFYFYKVEWHQCRSFACCRWLVQNTVLAFLPRWRQASRAPRIAYFHFSIEFSCPQSYTGLIFDNRIGIGSFALVEVEACVTLLTICIRIK